ncbi:MAG: hypothetical protein COU29_04170 [Candidatus Magasanikbacteria bacterium CG10_big_fil_rev_8_21_14_0_10_36_32]|uniref:DUF192 domain-containing protein n=1 Tax=Candidatus Magasanikbacteria bacterium CG10_big_fil_rev_8_21_14_0_10_36_32 TaxID=1974646 RepID=A0A2M6W5U7_9BACT|nr:MAG: hypothetical protein COU29_04170 [Candidatus Magasanikbacteria bacterium CG10_big_fil_rev_8_21_14_0_10_36_32]
MLWWGHKQQNQNAKVPIWFILFFILLIAVWGGLKIYDYVYWPEIKIKIGSSPELQVLVAERPSHTYRGLGGRESLGDYQGMLFLFSKKSQHIMVMRDMEFPLDIIWLDGDIIVDMAKNLPVEKGKIEAELINYGARMPSTAVLELPAGFIDQYGLIIGDKAQIVD